MQRLKSRGVTLLTVIGLFALSGIAMADSHDTEKNDTVFNYGYDSTNQFLIWNVSSLDYEVSEGVLAETFFENYQELLAACSLSPGEGEGPIVDGYSFDGETITLLLGSVEVEAPEGCAFLTGGGYVTGPNGQVNHGMFMKLFNSVYDGPGKGCLVRHLAKSDLGKFGDKVQADPAFEPTEEPAPIEKGTIEFTTESADCIHGKKAENGNGGPPQHVLDKWAQKWPDGKPGKGKGAGGSGGG